MIRGVTQSDSCCKSATLVSVLEKHWEITGKAERPLRKLLSLSRLETMGTGTRVEEVEVIRSGQIIDMF